MEKGENHRRKVERQVTSQKIGFLEKQMRSDFKKMIEVRSQKILGKIMSSLTGHEKK